MVHRVGAVTDDDAGHALLDLPAYGLRERCVLNRTHVLAEDTEELLGLQVAYAGKLGHGSVQLAGAEGRDHGPGPVVEPAGDGPSRPEQLHLRQPWIEREVLLRDLVVRLAGAHHGDGGHLGRGDADIVAAHQLEDDVPVIGGLGPRENHALEQVAPRHELDVVPDACSEPLEDLPGLTPVALQSVCRHRGCSPWLCEGRERRLSDATCTSSGVSSPGCPCFPGSWRPSSSSRRSPWSSVCAPGPRRSTALPDPPSR